MSDTKSHVPFSQNINWAQLVGIVAMILVAVTGGKVNLTPAQQLELVGAIQTVVSVYTVLIHTFVNHPANQEAAKAAIKSAVSTSKRSAPMILAFVLVASFMLSGCAAAGGSPSASAQDPLRSISTFTVTDLQSADADAVAVNDTVAHACYPALIQFIQSLPSSTGGTTVVGAFSAFQKARDLRNVAFAGVPLYLTMGCGPLYAQAHADLLLFLAGTGATMAVTP